jgi:hypothetical protein
MKCQKRIIAATRLIDYDGNLFVEAILQGSQH